MDIALINAVPFILAALLALPQVGVYIPRPVRAWGTAAVMAGLFVLLLGYFPAVEEAALDKSAVIQVVEWVPELGLTLSFYLDGLALMFALIVTGIGAGISLYAGYYFDDNDDQRRFLWQLMLFAGAMLGLVISGNLITMFIMWELTSVSSYLLIGFKGAKSEGARFGASQAFLVTGAGALALIVGLVMLGAITGQVLGVESGFVFELEQILKADLTGHPHFAAMAILIVIGAFTKSAQFPFHFWLPGAMEAPTPASAYLHSATMVKAGIYLLARLYPPMHDSNLWLVLLTGTGLLTMFLGAFFALSNKDLKAILAYSTVSKLGVIVALIGLPDYAGLKAAFISILAHALYKAALFLAAGTIDHNFGTRMIDHLGGLRRYMPAMMIVVIISALSMAGVPVFFGFVAKEVLLDAFFQSTFGGASLALTIAVVASVLTVVVAGMLIWDVFFKEPGEELHFHASSPVLTAVPGVMAAGSALLGLLLVPIVKPLIVASVPKEISLYLIPPDGLANTVFQLSLGVLAAGFVLFYTRGAWMRYVNLPIPKGTDLFRGLLQGSDAVGDFALRLQSGQVRYYLIVIFGTVGVVLLTSGLIGDLAATQLLAPESLSLSEVDLLKAIMLMLIVCAATMTIFFKKHIQAVLALGVVGYGVGALFLLEPAPDVALVQFLVETLATILIILILSRISDARRSEVMTRLWRGRTMITFYDKTGKLGPEHIQSQFRHFGLIRDGLIAAVVGIAVFLFALTALLNRPERESISLYHLTNTYTQLGVEDVVGAIVADYRAMDTIIEIGVFIAAAIGVLTLLSRGMPRRNPLVPADAYTHGEDADGVRAVTNLNTPFTRMVARLVLPLTFLIALVHLLLGSNAPGDGFTAGAITGLVTALWFVIFGYEETKQRLKIVAPYRLMRNGILLILVNALIPLFFFDGAFASYVNYGKFLGIAETLDMLNLKLTTTLVFEIGVAVAVFGGTSAIMETIAHPDESNVKDDV